MKPIQGWETKDGKRFFNEDDARIHEVLLDAEDKLYGDPLFFHGGLAGIENAKDLIEFLERNEFWILPMMGWRPKLRCVTQPAIGGGYYCKTCEQTLDEVDCCKLETK